MKPSCAASQVAKNIVLAGCGRLTLIDDTPCSQAAPGNFLVPAAAPPDARCCSSLPGACSRCRAKYQLYTGHAGLCAQHALVSGVSGF